MSEEPWLHLSFPDLDCDSASVCFECSLAQKKTAEKKVAITVFSFPPDKGNVGTAAYLNVFGSIYRVLQDLKAQGYTIEDVPEKEEDLLKLVSYLMITVVARSVLATTVIRAIAIALLLMPLFDG